MCLLRKDLKGAEDALLAQGRVEEAIAMYEKLHQYEAALALAKSRRLDPARVESLAARYFQVLLDTNQDQRAALLKEAEGDAEEAMRLYLKAGLPAQAARVLKENERSVKSGRAQWLELLAAALGSAGMHDRAGDCFEELGQLQRALDAYVRGGAFRKGVDLARRSFPGEVVKLEEAWGDWLVGQKQLDMAINHYIEARANGKAMEAALSARQWTKAAQLVEALDGGAARPYYKKLARHHEDAGQLQLAEKFYVRADAPELAVDMYTKANQWEAAHKLASSYMSEGEVRMLYIDQAQKLEAIGKLREAERLLVQVNEADMAISLYKRHRRYDDMVRLVTAHRGELLKETHMFLAQQLEVEGDFTQAEGHYAAAGEWLAAVNMFRGLDMWEDALRVARHHGGAAAQKRVAYAWALALGGGDKGARALTKHGLVDAAIDYAAELRDFANAFELARAAAPARLPDIHLKHGMFLEDEERFAEAEAEFVLAGKPREAVDMLVHQKDWTGALRVAQEQEPAAVPDVLCAEADDALATAAAAGGEALESARSRAETLFLQASRPERALAMWEEAGQYTEALRVCGRHLPHRLAEVEGRNQAAQAVSGRGGTKANYLATARAYEQSRNWAGAIDALLQARAGTMATSGAGTQELEDVWSRALDIARTQAPNRHVAVAREVASRLVALGRHEAAADALRDARQLEEAAEVAMGGGAWDKAREVATGHAALAEQVERAYQRHLVRGEAADELVEIGQTSAALDIIAQRGDWTRLWEVAARENVPPAALARYAALRVTGLLKEIEAARQRATAAEDGAAAAAAAAAAMAEAVGTLAERGLPGAKEAMGMYEGLVKAVLGMTQEEEAAAEKLPENSREVVAGLRGVLYDLWQATSGGKGGQQRSSKAADDVEHLLLAAHYSALLQQCARHGGRDCAALAARMALTLLRYSDLAPADKCFYRAGRLAREVGEQSLGFVLLNRYVDLAEAIDEGDASLVDNSDFAHATNIPVVDAATLPRYHYLGDEAKREEVRDWVLGVCVDASVEQQLPSAADARGTIYEVMFASELPTCVVTGYPIAKQLLEVNGTKASKRDWNTYVRTFKHCPWTGKPQTPQY